MDQLQAKRFHYHYQFLKDVPEHGFYMGNWFRASKESLSPKRQDASCGSAACWAGWLSVSLPGDWETSSFNYGKSTRILRRGNTGARNIFCDLADYFGIETSDAEQLCLPQHYLSGCCAHPLEVSDVDVSKISIDQVRMRMVQVADKHGWDITGPEPQSLFQEHHVNN